MKLTVCWISYFRKFNYDFATVAILLTSLTKKDIPFVDSDSQPKAFEELKERLISKQLFTIYDTKVETELHTDASK